MFLILKTTDWKEAVEGILIRENDSDWREPLVEVTV